MKKADIGLIGLAVMGENLALNMESKGFTVAVYNRTAERVHDFILGRGQGKNLIGATDIKSLIGALSRPRKVFLMVKAGKPVDDCIETLIPHLEKGDIIIDGGNSYFVDTVRRAKYVEDQGFLFIGTGVSGGEEGALKGPSIMPGGSPAAWDALMPILTAISAKADGKPCCDYVGSGGAGHFVKMVHNGIEYGDMQLICETYDIMRKRLHMSPDEMAAVFDEWNGAELDSYLIEITANILKYKDSDGSPLIDKILDKAGQKGTGKWTVMSAMDEGVPLTLIAEAVFARSLSAAKKERVAASKVFSFTPPAFNGDKRNFISALKDALYCAKIMSYAQGYTLLAEASRTYGWSLNFGAIALMWRGGCIIRSKFLGKIKAAFDADPSLSNLMLDAFFRETVQKTQQNLRKVCAEAVLGGIPVPALSAAVAYFDGFREGSLPANLLQAQRDYFGAHTYERTDKNEGEYFHTDWTGTGGKTASTTYNA